MPLEHLEDTVSSYRELRSCFYDFISVFGRGETELVIATQKSQEIMPTMEAPMTVCIISFGF